jgi:hypothetical protein
MRTVKEALQIIGLLILTVGFYYLMFLGVRTGCRTLLKSKGTKNVTVTEMQKEVPKLKNCAERQSKEFIDYYDIDYYFNSYQFSYTDTLNAASKDSLTFVRMKIKSCDGKFGILRLASAEFEKDEYLTDVPIKLWEKLKTSKNPVLYYYSIRPKERLFKNEYETYKEIFEDELRENEQYEGGSDEPYNEP